MSSRGQGTIEYLVIVAVIIVIALFVTAFLLTTGDNSISLVSTSSSHVEGYTNSIIVVESAVDGQGDGIFSLQDLSADHLSLSTVVPDNNHAKVLNASLVQTSNDTYNLYVTDLNTVCDNGEEGKLVSCNLVVTLTTLSGLPTQVFVRNALRAGDVNAIILPPEEPSTPSDTTAPEVLLLSPADNTNSATRTIDFTFDATDDGTLSSCTLFIDGVSDTVMDKGLVQGENTIQKVFTTDKLVDWNVSCTDDNSNTGTTSALTLDVDANAYQITTCLELQDMNLHLNGDFELMNTVDCSDTVNWNGGAGFTPIGGDTDTAHYFTGSLNGNDYTVSEVTINNSTAKVYTALFGKANESAYFHDFTLSDINYSISNFGAFDSPNVGGLVGMYQNDGSENPTLVQSVTISGAITMSTGPGSWPPVGGVVGYVLGWGTFDSVVTDVNIQTGNGTAGGIVGINWGGRIRYSKAINDVNGRIVGGLVGSSDSGGDSHIVASFAAGNITGDTKVGGIIGENFFSSSVENSYATGRVTATTSLAGGLVGYNHTSAYDVMTANILNSYATGAVTSPSTVGSLIGKSENTGASSTQLITNSFGVGSVNGSTALGGLIGTKTGSGVTLTNDYWDVTGTGQAQCTSGGAVSGCTAKNTASAEPNYWYFDGNSPLAAWGTWVQVSGNEYATTDGNWSICNGAGYPWLTWEDRSCA